MYGKKSFSASLGYVLTQIVKQRIWGLCAVAVLFIKGILNF